MCQQALILETASLPWPPTFTFYKLLEIERREQPISTFGTPPRSAQAGVAHCIRCGCSHTSLKIGLPLTLPAGELASTRLCTKSPVRNPTQQSTRTFWPHFGGF